MWYGPERPKWLGPVEYSYPQHLRGSAPGDYGYDPASLSQEPADFDRYFNYEVLHGRWAMLGGLGALVPGACELATYKAALRSAAAAAAANALIGANTRVPDL